MPSGGGVAAVECRGSSAVSRRGRAAGLSAFCDLPALYDRLAAAPDLWLAVAGLTATAVLAALAAFELSVPGHSPR